jgi:hypothetical protein
LKSCGERIVPTFKAICLWLEDQNLRAAAKRWGYNGANYWLWFVLSKVKNLFQNETSSSYPNAFPVAWQLIATAATVLDNVRLTIQPVEE